MASQASIQKKLIWDIYTAIRPELSGLGFEQVRPGFFRLSISPDATGWLTLGTVQASRGAGAGIFPQVSLLIREIERLRAAIDGREQDPDQHTFGGPLYLLMANPMKDNTWEFGPGADNAMVRSDLVAAIGTYGVPYLKNFPDPQSLLEYFGDGRRGRSFPNISYVLPMTHYVIGDIPGARRTLLQYLNAAERSGSPIYVKTYSEFAGRFERFIHEHANGDRNA
jgi:hypothetical protein